MLLFNINSSFFVMMIKNKAKRVFIHVLQAVNMNVFVCISVPERACACIHVRVLAGTETQPREMCI